MEFKSNTPCNNCPYRKDAPRQHWHKEEFKKLVANDHDWCPVYGCHKGNGSVCVGWLMDQKARNFPSLPLRMLLMRLKISADWLDTLHSPSEMFSSIQEMVKSNFKRLKPKKCG